MDKFKKLDQLIEQVLAERAYPIADFPAKFNDKSKEQYDDNDGDIQSKIQALAVNAPDEKVVDKVDVVKAMQNDSADEKEAIGFLNQALPQDDWKEAEVEKALQTLTGQDLSMGAGEAQVIDLEKQQTIGFSQMQTVSADPEDPNQMGEYPEGAATAFNQIFKGIGSFKERMVQLSKVMTEVFGGHLNGTASEDLAKVIVADYVTTLVKTVDAGAAAYRFEMLLAMMAGGRVTGKSSAKDSSGKETGKMGAVDFVMANGAAGSSKYLVNLKGQATQGIGGFEMLVPVTYVLAHKKASRDIDISGGKAPPEKMVQINIWVVTAMKYYEDDKEWGFMFQDSAGNISTKMYPKKWKEPTEKQKAKGKTEPKLQNGKITLDGSTMLKGNPMVVPLVAADDRNLAEVIKSATGASKASLDEYTKAIKSLGIANEKAMAYAASGNPATGDQALLSLNEAESGLLALAQNLSAPKVSAATAAKKIQENKFTALDKLIEAVMLEEQKKGNQ